jgi:hypothetical protein
MDDYEARAAALVESAVARLAARSALTPQQVREITETLLRLADRVVPPELRAVLAGAGERR